MRHVHTSARPQSSLVDTLCDAEPSVEMIGEATRSIYGAIDCSDCLRRAIAEGEERTRVLRELLDKVEALS